MEGNHCYVYLLTNELRHNIYVGMGYNLDACMASQMHQSSNTRPAAARCTRLVYFEKHADISRARVRTESLRRASIVKKMALVERTNPGWCDLAAVSGVELQKIKTCA